MNAVDFAPLEIQGFEDDIGPFECKFRSGCRGLATSLFDGFFRRGKNHFLDLVGAGGQGFIDHRGHFRRFDPEAHRDGCLVTGHRAVSGGVVVNRMKLKRGGFEVVYLLAPQVLE